MIFDFEYFDMAMRGDCIEDNEDVLEKKERTMRYNEMTNDEQQSLYHAVHNHFTICPNMGCEL